MFNNLTYFDTQEWDDKVSKLIINEILLTASQNGFCNLMVTGGNTASRIYQEMHKFFVTKGYPKLNIYFTDEKCVSLGFGQTNYELFYKSFGCNALPEHVKINRINCENNDIAEEARIYGDRLEHIDLMLLTIGDDGHIASLFKLDKKICGNDKNYLPILRNIPFVSRISITPKLIGNVNKIFVFAKGEKKHKILKNAVDEIKEYEPISLLKNAVWFVDKII
jgi:6-phosphogluconolactonase